VERARSVEETGMQLVDAECAVRARSVEERTLTGGVDEDDGRGGRNAGIPQYAFPAHAPFVEEPDQYVTGGHCFPPSPGPS
jgi:hypothetical protein